MLNFLLEYCHVKTLVVCVRLMCVYFGLFGQRIDLFNVSSILIRYLLAMSRDVCIARTRRSARPCLPLMGHESAT